MYVCVCVHLFERERLKEERKETEAAEDRGRCGVILCGTNGEGGE